MGPTATPPQIPERQGLAEPDTIGGSGTYSERGKFFVTLGNFVKRSIFVNLQHTRHVQRSTCDAVGTNQSHVQRAVGDRLAKSFLSNDIRDAIAWRRLAYPLLLEKFAELSTRRRNQEARLPAGSVRCCRPRAPTVSPGENAVSRRGLQIARTSGQSVTSHFLCSSRRSSWGRHFFRARDSRQGRSPYPQSSIRTMDDVRTTRFAEAEPARGPRTTKAMRRTEAAIARATDFFGSNSICHFHKLRPSARKNCGGRAPACEDLIHLLNLPGCDANGTIHWDAGPQRGEDEQVRHGCFGIGPKEQKSSW